MAMSKTTQDTTKEMLEAMKQEQDPTMNTDRRIRAKRLSVVFPVQFSHKGSPVQGWAEAQNLSFSGMLVITNFPVNVYDEYSIEFTLPTQDVPVQIACRVVRVISGKTPTDPTQAAVSFLNIDPHVSKLISGYVLEHISAF